MPNDLILFLAANPDRMRPLALDEECAAIERELRMAPTRDFAFRAGWAITDLDLVRKLTELQPTVLHFSGHGCCEVRGGPGTGRSRDLLEPGADPAARAGIYLHGSRGGSQLVDGRALGLMIKSAAPSVRVVVLNACYSDALADELSSVVDCVIGMTGEIADEAARLFAVAFYLAVANHRSIGDALKLGAAMLAAKQLPNEQLPRCRTRDGIDQYQLVLTGRSKPQSPPSDPIAVNLSWTRRFDAVVQHYRAVHDNVVHDPRGAAEHARQALEHIADYLHERELGPAARSETLDAKLKRVDAKQVIPRLVAIHVGSVQSHTSSIINAGGSVVPEPSFLAPCIGSLDIVVEWFFRDYVKQPAPIGEGRTLSWSTSHAQPAPDDTPHSTMGTVLTTETWVGVRLGESTAIWRPTPAESTLRIDATDGTGDFRLFRIADPTRSYLIGRMEREDDTHNDFALPTAWNSISRQQGRIMTRDGTVVFTNTSTTDNVFVRSEVVSPATTRSLRHGDSVQFGRHFGTFLDGRYYPNAPAGAVDRLSGLISRAGLIAEISYALETHQQRLLFVLRCPDDTVAPSTGAVPRDPEHLAAAVALAVHRQDTSLPVARIGVDVAALLGSASQARAAAATAATVVGRSCVSGFVPLAGTPEQSLPKLEGCLSALRRIAIAGREYAGPEDLTRYTLTPTPLDEFAACARPLFALGGGAILIVLGELERLERMAPEAIPVLELELIEMLGARIGPLDIVAFAGRGALVLGTPGDAERLARDIDVEWHAKGPMSTATLEIDRSLSAHLLASSDLDDIGGHGAELACGFEALATSGLPAPLALAARTVNETHDPVGRMHGLRELVELAWKLLAFVLVAAARDLQARDREGHHDTARQGGWPTPWRALAHSVADTMRDQPARVSELAAVASSPDCDEAIRAALELLAGVIAATTERGAIERALPRLERAVREVFAALRPLRGWTLIGVVSSEVVGVDGAQRIEYVDYTGPGARGSHRRITVVGLRNLGRFVHLVRLDDLIAIPLEPFVRRVHNELSGHDELFIANALVVEPGIHRYRSIASGREIDLEVTNKQLGALDREGLSWYCNLASS